MSKKTKHTLESLRARFSELPKTPKAVEKPIEVETIKQDAEQKEAVKPSVKAEAPTITFLGMGGLNGEYRFAEIPGSISATSLEEAYAKAIEIATKFPNLLNK